MSAAPGSMTDAELIHALKQQIKSLERQLRLMPRLFSSMELSLRSRTKRLRPS